MRKLSAVQARRDDLHARRADQGERRRARRDRVARQRQAARRRRGRHRRRGRPPALLRGLADEDRGRDDPGLRPRPLRLHAARAGRRLRPDRPLELPAADGGLEDRPRARRRLPADPQAGRADAAERAAPRRARARGGLPGGHVQRPHRRRRDRRGAGRRPRRRQGRVHRLDRRSGARSAPSAAGRSSGSRSSSAARARTSSSPTPTSTPRQGLASRPSTYNSGQACNAGSRLLVQSDLFDEVVAQARRLRLAGQGRPRPRPRVASSARSSPRSSSTGSAGYIDAGLEEGAEAVAGGDARTTAAATSSTRPCSPASTTR